LQQVLLLQSQYGQLEEGEMAATVAANGADLSPVDRAVNMARGLRSRMDVDMQLGILRDSQLALELSETTVILLNYFIALLTVVSSQLRYYAPSKCDGYHAKRVENISREFTLLIIFGWLFFVEAWVESYENSRQHHSK
jgi:hypothetical protein